MISAVGCNAATADAVILVWIQIIRTALARGRERSCRNSNPAETGGDGALKQPPTGYFVQ